MVPEQPTQLHQTDSETTMPNARTQENAADTEKNRPTNHTATDLAAGDA